jgi:hypothetical protein
VLLIQAFKSRTDELPELFSLVMWTRIEAKEQNRQSEDDHDRAHYGKKLSVSEIDRHCARVGFGTPSFGLELGCALWPLADHAVVSCAFLPPVESA